MNVKYRTYRFLLHGLLPVALITLLAWLTACSTTGCTDNRSSIPLAGFYAYDTGSSISLDSIDVGGIGAPADSLLLAAGHTAREVYLPLRAEKTATAFCFAYRYKALDYPELNDTLTFHYDATPYFASEECGAMYRYRINEVVYTRHLLDSVAIIPDDSIITNADIENLRLYFKTSPAEHQ